MGELVASVISRRAVRQHFDDDRGIEQGVNVLIFETRFAAGDHNVGVGVQAGGVDLTRMSLEKGSHGVWLSWNARDAVRLTVIRLWLRLAPPMA